MQEDAATMLRLLSSCKLLDIDRIDEVDNM